MTTEERIVELEVEMAKLTEQVETLKRDLAKKKEDVDYYSRQWGTALAERDRLRTVLSTVIKAYGIIEE